MKADWHDKYGLQNPYKMYFHKYFSLNKLDNLPVFWSLGFGLGDLDRALLLEPVDSDDLDLELCAASLFNLLVASDLEGAGLDDLVRP